MNEDNSKKVFSLPEVSAENLGGVELFGTSTPGWGAGEVGW